jgi:hypothetical protein
MKIATIVALALCLTGCIRTVGNWEKPGADQQQFAVDKFDCMKQSQQQVSSMYVNQYGGSGGSAQTTNMPLFGACMNAHGYSWVTKQVEG